MSVDANAFPRGDDGNDRFLDFTNDHNPDDKVEYLEQKAREINQGKPTWVVRNFVSDETVSGALVYEFYVNGKLCGFIDQEDQYADAYVVEEDGQPTLDKSFTSNFLHSNLVSAIDYLETTVN